MRCTNFHGNPQIKNVEILNTVYINTVYIKVDSSAQTTSKWLRRVQEPTVTCLEVQAIAQKNIQSMDTQCPKIALKPPKTIATTKRATTTCARARWVATVLQFAANQVQCGFKSKSVTAETYATSGSGSKNASEGQCSRPMDSNVQCAPIWAARAYGLLLPSQNRALSKNGFALWYANQNTVRIVTKHDKSSAAGSLQLKETHWRHVLCNYSAKKRSCKSFACAMEICMVIHQIMSVEIPNTKWLH